MSASFDRSTAAVPAQPATLAPDQTGARAGGLHMAWATLFIEGLAASGIRDLIASPGSRSTPLLLAALGHPALRVHDVVDERSAGFFALGMAKAGAPAALLCTSGSAGAHYFPAVIEAAHTFTPLLIVTADRPLEHSGCGAAQAIDQVKLFGDHVRGFFELGVPDPHPDALRGVRRMAAQSVARTRGPEPGPVHVNARFRKPLEPVEGAPEPNADLLVRRLRELDAVPFPNVLELAAVPDPDAIEALARACRDARLGLIVAGPAPLPTEDPRPMLEALAEATGFPVLAEPGSDFRLAGSSDPFLRSRVFRDGHRPDLILQFGGAPVSEGVCRLVDENPGCPRWVIAPHGWNDPHNTATALVRADALSVARALVRALGVRSIAARGPDVRAEDREATAARWRSDFASAAAAVEEEVTKACATAPFWDGAVARAVAERIPTGSLLALGNSLPIRDFGTWTAGLRPEVRVFTQRGANGIDGLISGAAGAAHALDRPATLLVGDLSFLHDLHGLAVARSLEVPFVVVVVQNRGGRIFEQLPLGKDAEAGTLAHWVTPNDFDLSYAARLFGHRFAGVDSANALKGALAEAHRREGCTVIEAVVPPHEGAARYRRLWDGVDKKIRDLGGRPRRRKREA